MRKPTATRMFCSGIRTMKTMTPTPAIVVYWRFRYALAPSCTAAEIARMRSFPGDSASREREVTAPYTMAHDAHTRATRTPCCVRKLDKKVLRESSLFKKRDGSRAQRKKGPPPHRAGPRHKPPR